METKRESNQLCKGLFKNIRSQARSNNYHAYLILDGAWQTELAMHVRNTSKEGWEPLMGLDLEKKEEIHEKSPILVDLDVHEFVVPLWLAEGFPEKMGIVVFSKKDITTIRRSLKRFTLVMTPESDEPSYFRFYDARSLYCFLRFGYKEQWQDFFRDIDLIAAPSDIHKGWTLYRVREDALEIKIHQPKTGGYHTNTCEAPRAKARGITALTRVTYGHNSSFACPTL